MSRIRLFLIPADSPGCRCGCPGSNLTAQRSAGGLELRIDDVLVIVMAFLRVITRGCRLSSLGLLGTAGGHEPLELPYLLGELLSLRPQLVLGGSGAIHGLPGRADGRRPFAARARRG